MPPTADGPRLRGTGVRVVLATAPDQDTGETLIRTVVDERLAACGNIVPGVASIFRWDGRVERAAEVLLILKTTEDVVPALQARVAALHPYDVPEILSLAVDDGHEPYLEWVGAETGEAG